MKRIWRKIPLLLKPPYLYYVLYAFAAITVLYLLTDFVLMPLYTRQYQSIPVPNVTFLPMQEADKKLSDAGLRSLRASDKFDDHYPAGTVLFQQPEAGAPVKKGRRIYLTIGKGQRIFAMPKLIGLAERDAKFVLNDHELVLSGIDYRRDEFYPDGVVCTQSILPDRTVSAGEKVYLVVSLGLEPTEFVVPNLVGKSREEAAISLLKAGLNLGLVERQVTNELLPNTIVNQRPDAGLQVAKGDTVNIVVSILPDAQ